MCRSPHAGAIQIQDRTDFCLQMTKKKKRRKTKPPQKNPKSKKKKTKKKERKKETKLKMNSYITSVRNLCVLPQRCSLQSVDKKTISLKLQFHDLRLG